MQSSLPLARLFDLAPLRLPASADVMVGDRERCGGFYILGQPRTGKSNLLISMALSDIEKGTSILFIDPHTDAITDLLSHIPQEG